MAKQGLGEKTVRELRAMAKRAGLAVKGDWKKEDLVKVLSLKKKSAANPGKPAKKAKPVKLPKKAKKTASGKTKDKKNVAHKTAGNKGIKKSATKTAIIVTRKIPPKKTSLADLSSEEVKPLPESAPAPMPAEYCGDRIVSMQVTPGRIYVYWEVAEDRLAKYKGSLNLKVLDTEENYFFYSPVSGRIGESFININPDSHYAVKIGIIDSRGEFVNIMQPESAAVTEAHSEMPAGGPGAGAPACEGPEMTEPEQKVGMALPEDFFEVPEPVSSY